MKLFTLVAELELATNNFTTGVNNARADMTDLKNDMGIVQQEAQNTGSILESALGHALGDFLSSAASALSEYAVEFGKDSITIEASAEQTNEKMKALFGQEGADTVRQWATTTKEQFGISENAAKQYVSDIAGLWGSEHLGFSTEELTGMAMKLVELTGDLASFNNFSVAETWTKILSGMRGETEAIEDLGIDLRAASIAPYFDMKESDWGKLDQKERILKTYEYALAMTTHAQGDFARTSDTYQNQLAMMTANIEELKEALGTELLPVMNELVTWFNSLFGGAKSGSEAIEDVGTTLGDTYANIEVTTANALALVNALQEMEKAGVDTAEEQSIWNGLLDDLSKTLPGIDSLLNSTTGAINGGTTALKEYVTQWQATQREVALAQAMQESMNEVTKAQTDLVKAQLELDIAKRTQGSSEERQAGYMDQFRGYLQESHGWDQEMLSNAAAVTMELMDMVEAGDAFAVMIAGLMDDAISNDDADKVKALESEVAAAQLALTETQAKYEALMASMEHLQKTTTEEDKTKESAKQPVTIVLQATIDGQEVSTILTPKVVGAAMDEIDWKIAQAVR